MPEEGHLFKALEMNEDKIVVILKDGEIVGCALYLTLTDDSYKAIDKLNIADTTTLARLLKETGDNLHFIMVAARDMSTIRCGMRKVKREKKPRTVSWWNPNMTKLHRYSGN